MKTIFKTNGERTYTYQDVYIYDLIKQDLESTGLFEPEDITLGLLNMGQVDKFDDEYHLIQIIRDVNTNSFSVRYLKEIQIRTEPYFIFFTKKVKVPVWETIYYRIFENKNTQDI